MAIMLRSQGIPARVVSGYAQGAFQEEESFYRVRASNAHTWTEVYFADYGWIQFEPTAAIPIIDRPENTDGGGGDAFSAFNSNLFELNRDELLGEEAFNEGDGPNLDALLPGDEDVGAGALEPASIFDQLPVWQLVTGVVILVGAVGVSIAGNQYNQRVETDINRSYGRLEQWSRWLGLIIRPAHTPYERARMITTAVPDSEEPVQNLTNQYVVKKFSPHKEENESPADEWQTLRPVMIRSTIFHFFNQIGSRFSRRKE